MNIEIKLREVLEEDLAIFYEQQNEPIANLMAAFPPRNEEDFMTHWKTKILGVKDSYKNTILFKDEVVGNLLSWKQDGRCFLGYWIGKEYWGKGIATAAVKEFLNNISERPVYAYVMKHNKGSIKVLEKCGFKFVGSEMSYSELHGEEREECFFVYSE